MSRTTAVDKSRTSGGLPRIVPAWVSDYAAIVSGLGARLHGYWPAVAAVSAAFLAHGASVAMYGPGRTPVVTFIYLFAFLIAAWCGYGPGLVATTAIAVGSGYFFRANFSIAQMNFSTVAVFLSLSVVISAKASSRRRVEALLQSINAELDARVHEQTVALEEANATMQDRLAELETLYGKLSIGLCFLDSNLQFVRVNEKFASISSVPMQDHLNRELRDVVDRPLADTLERLCRRVMAMEEPIVDHEVSVAAGNGKGAKVWSVSCSPVPSASSVIGLQLAMQDITERKQAENALSQANRELRRANEDLEQFAFSASHDLQEPIRTVSIYSQMLKKRFARELGPDGETYLSFAVGGALQMEQVVKDLLAYTQASSPSTGPPELVDMKAALEHALNNLQGTVGETQARIDYGTLPEVAMRRTHAVQLLQSLIGNSIKYRGFNTPQVEIKAEPTDGGRWLFSIKDHGIGIDPKYQEQIFGIFKRLHTMSEYPGTGMGLAICRRIVERYGGTIGVQSELGKGATFFFTLPGAGVS
jgi:PAS domain S-box-containing protein